MPDAVTIGVMADHHLDFVMVRDLVKLIHDRWNEIGGRVIWAIGDVGHLDIGRNRVAENFLKETTSEWLLWLDTDMSFRATDFDALYHRGASIVSGLYYRDTDPPTPCMFRYKDGHAKVLKDFRPGAMVSVDVAGMGFMLTHREVLEKMAAARFSQYRPWFDNSALGPAGQPLADDSSFCARAKELGYNILVDTAVVLGHIKPKVIR